MTTPQDPQAPLGPDLRQAAAQEYPELAPPPSQAYALGPDGQPVATAVPEDFGKAQEDRYASQLTPEEVAEFRELRAEKKARDAAAAKEAEEAAAKLTPPTHFVHLADGTIVDGHQIATHYDTGDGVIPVASVFEKEPVLL
jgi:hypothetical protein